MFNLPEIFCDLNVLSILLRLGLSLIFGGIIGLERGTTRQPAGFRTHILVCMGAALAMLTNQYICNVLGYTSDPARLGAQVITGVGFLGVGTILVTGKNRIRGLTTAAGLWASACLGLAIGVGFYEGAVIGVLLIYISLSLLPRIEDFVYTHSGILNVYIELEKYSEIIGFIEELKAKNVVISEKNLNNTNPMTPGGIALILSLKMPKELKGKDLLEDIRNMRGVTIVDEI